MTFLDFFYIIRTKITSHLYLKFKIGLSGVLDWAWIPPSFFRKLKSWGNSGVGLDLVTGSFSEDFSWALAAIRVFMMLEVNSGISGESVKWLLVVDKEDISGNAEVIFNLFSLTKTVTNWGISGVSIPFFKSF